MEAFVIVSNLRAECRSCAKLLDNTEEGKE